MISRASSSGEPSLSSALSQSTGQETFFSQDGYLVEFYGESWVLNKDVSIPIGGIDLLLDSSVSHSFKRVLSHFSKTHSAAHSMNIFYRCKAYLESTRKLMPFSVESLVSYRSTLSAATEWYISVIRGFVRQWVRLGYGGIPDEASGLLDQWTLKGNFKGYAVQSMCPDSGPLTDVEMQGIVSGLIEAYCRNKLSLSTSCCAMIIVMTGRRPAQVSALKIKDIFSSSGKYWINFPRAKQRGGVWRGAFKKFAVGEDLWLLIQEQISAVVKYFSSLIGRKVPESVLGDLPIFPIKNQSFTLAELSSKLNGDFLHLPVRDIKDMMSVVSDTLDVTSERTGDQMRLNSRRFRYTLGTNLAREGKGEYVIAEALDHSDTQNAGVYVKNVPDIVKRIDIAVALQLAPIAQAFRGVLVSSESEAQRGSDPSSRISNGRANVGSCGSYGFCGALAPIACYTCVHFQPWINGPHEEVLMRLLEDRDRVVEQTGDIKIASANDRLILAVSDVIHRCKVARGEP
ncbi:tyrosine-type recombinase/integrase [Pseudomonas aeruginosa]|uniref:site-specific integrase n=1 Tax=Pseudomonas aeruginosa TaxID=287 RepID=UPI002116986A|nr:site-specific integrase [Pseudomonas aeruginosa]UUH88010.1 tyrosine-type recombinase/integrase [Pseudomonas aeruginosa]HCR1326676.1 tyrosine-type recombinase/integrase [Pseudomonas aeruginosa]